MKTNKLVCMFCNENEAKYTCPRCLVQYCSVKCFQHKSHENCSETFYKDQILTELKGMRGTQEEREKVNNILRNVKQQADEDNNVQHITERLDGVDLENSDVVWEKLTQYERDMFQRNVSKGNLDFVPIWTPWWHIGKRTKIHDLSSKDVSGRKHLPKIIKDLPKLKDVLRDKSPDSNLKFCLMDILLAYTCLQRMFNGDLYDSHMETTSMILHLSKVLSENKIYCDLDSCIHCFINTIVMSSDIGIDPIETSLKDLYQIVISDDSYVLRVLSDFYVYLKKCSKHLKMENVQLSQQLFKISKKVYFYLMYCVEFETDVKFLSSDIYKIQTQLLNDRSAMTAEKEVIEENLDKLKPIEKKKLIEEI